MSRENHRFNQFFIRHGLRSIMLMYNMEPRILNDNDVENDEDMPVIDADDSNSSSSDSNSDIEEIINRDFPDIEDPIEEMAEGANEDLNEDEEENFDDNPDENFPPIVEIIEDENSDNNSMSL